MRLLLLFCAIAIALQAADNPLFDAIRRADTTTTKRLLDSGVSPNAVDADNVPVLMAAVLFAGPDTVKLLLDRKANPNATLPNGATALLWAMPDLEKARLLIAAGADVNARSTNLGRTPLLVAASYPRSVDTLRFLLEKGADLRASDRNGAHALTLAARFADVDVVRFLVERGIEVNEPGRGGALPLSRILSRQYAPAIEFLLEKGGRIRKEDMPSATSWMDPKLIAKLLEFGDPNARSTPFGRTPAIFAASSLLASAATLRLLLETGADPNLADADGETPLDWAMHHSDQAKIDVLKQHGGKDAATPRDKTYPPPEGIADARTSLTRSVALLLPASQTVFQKRACITCHQQSMPAQVAALARQKGIAINEELAKKNLAQIVAVYKPQGAEAMQGVEPPGGELTIGYIAMALAGEKHPLDRMTAGLTHMVAARQMPDGSWPEFESRPPMEYSTISRTAMAVRTLTLYPIEGRRREIDAKLALARNWLLAAKPQSAEEYAMRLMALAWTRAARREVEAAAKEWIAQQRPDGGWPQQPHLDSDAYATGITLFALHEAGIPTNQKGIRYLLKIQYQDGSWLVKTRAFPVQPQMESGYPFGYNQWISAAAASWASMAIAYTLPDGKP